MTDVLQTDYEQLQAIAGRFGQASQESAETLQRIQQQMARLQSTWLGRGSAAFFAEMQGEVLPATKRLIEALAQAQQVTQQIAQMLRAAEQEAAALFKSEGRSVPVHAAFLQLPAGSGTQNPQVSPIPTSYDDPMFGRLPRDVQAKWDSLTYEERDTVIRNMASELAQRYGIEPPPTIVIDCRENPTKRAGKWVPEENTIYLDADYIKVAGIHAVAHEMRHAYQDQVVEDYLRTGRIDPTKGITQQQIETWHNDMVRGHWSSEGYWNSSVEVDARQAGKEHVEKVTVADIERNLKPIPVPPPTPTPSPSPSPIPKPIPAPHPTPTPTPES